MTYERARSRLGERPPTIVVGETTFQFVTNQRGFESAIYRSPTSFMRIGMPGKIDPDLILHKKMEAKGFPVARLLAEGERDGMQYFIEESLGEEHMGELFARSYLEKAAISNELFSDFLSVVDRFARAQVTTRTESQEFDEFRKNILLPEMCEELPDMALAMEERFTKVCEHLADVPFVLSHGDLNPHNMYPTGVIDLENSFNAPYGYDLVSAICHIDSMPDSGAYEISAGYRFSPEQIQAYYERVDAISREAGMVPVSTLREDFEYCRALWLAARMHETPNLQQFRYDFVWNRFLKP